MDTLPVDTDYETRADHRTHLRNRAAWGAIFAGIATILVIQLLLNILGIGVGASSLDAANMSDNPTAAGFSTTAAVWWTVSGIVASLVGGLVAGRLSGSAKRSTAAWHGFVTWAAATLVMAWLLTSAAGGILGGTFNALGSTIGALGRGAATAATGVAQSTNGDALQAQARRLINPNDAQTAQDNVLTYIRASLSGDKATADAARDRAVDSIAKAANISPDEAKARLQSAEDQARQAANTAKQKAQEAAEVARKSLATAGIFGFIALLLGGIAGTIGGRLGAPALVDDRRS